MMPFGYATKVVTCPDKNLLGRQPFIRLGTYRGASQAEER